jgi:hypothetical protein
MLIQPHVLVPVIFVAVASIILDNLIVLYLQHGNNIAPG